MNETSDKSLTAEHMFATPLVRARHPGLSALIQPLKTIILREKASAEGISRSNEGGWHSKPDMLGWAGTPAESLSGMAADICERHIIDTTDNKGLRKGWGVDMWANVNAAGHANATHCHPGAFASAVFYIDMGNEGAPVTDGHIVMEDPRYPMAHMQYPNVLWAGPDGQGVASQHAILPTAGELIIFPSWLRHSVKPHSGVGERISIAINLTLQWHKTDGIPS